MAKPIAIDPEGCGCTECLTGLYVPLEMATGRQIRKLLKGRLHDHTGERFFVNEEKQHGSDVPVVVTVRGEYSNRTWTWTKEN